MSLPAYLFQVVAFAANPLHGNPAFVLTAWAKPPSGN
jgi:hypothetical protein